ncbi:MAG: hypothetical protein AAGJ86_02885 [Pseudomonadota bacterium]
MVAAVAALPFVAGIAQANEYLSGEAFTPDHAALQAAKATAPNAFVMPATPMMPDPRIATPVPGDVGTSDYWTALKRAQAQTRINAAAPGGVAAVTAIDPSTTPVEYTESESEEGANDSVETAERVKRLKTGKSRKRNTATVTGSLGEGLIIRELIQQEDDGAIPLALQSGVTGGPDGISFSGVIGDGPAPGVVADYDMVALSLPANTTFEISVTTPDPFGDLDPVVSFFLDDGTLIFQQDDGGTGFDSFATLTVGANPLNLVLAIGGFGAFEPANPFDSLGGSATGLIGSEGSYDFQLRVFPSGDGDVDFYTFKLDKGDVLGAAARIDGNPSLDIFNMNGEFEKGVTGFGTFAVAESPLPIDGNGVIDYVAEETGMYAIAISGGFGPYELDLGIYRPGFEELGRRVQLLWVDYNGGPVSKEPWFGFPFVTDHTPFRDFLPALDLPNTPADVRRITNRITAGVRKTYETDLEASEENPNTAVAVMGNDGTGMPNFFEALIDQGSFTFFGTTFDVSVVEVSGTIDEAFISTIGISQSIDTGNYNSQESALVLLDVLTAPATPGASANNTFTLNDIVLAEGVTKEDMVVEVMSNIITHEAGHYIGNWHTDGVFSANQGIMDEGPGGLFNLAGIGPSGIFGAEDTVDAAFIDDAYSTFEGFRGEENTTVNTAYSLTFTNKKEIKRD